jgi:SAM-dependent methyltransferase
VSKQQLAHQKGEIDFRKKLYMQQVEGQVVFRDEFDATGIERILKDRMHKTLLQMTSLQKRDIVLSPYIEIGAERCQRSLVMENDLELNGAALDISFDMLKSCNHYQEVLNKPKSPLRICCDANNLPFMSGSIRFVFCYETLHHFPEPAPITNEIYRVLLPGGCFFFDEEPYKQLLHINLYKGKKLYSEESLTRGKIKRALDHFFSERCCNEADHGVLENDDISLSSWKDSLRDFEGKDIQLKAISRIQSALYNPSSYLRYLAAYLFGGVITGICRKQGSDTSQPRSIHEGLICPSCRGIEGEILLEHIDTSYLCPHCSKRYPTIDGVIFLFAYQQFEELYPDVFQALQRST